MYICLIVIHQFISPIYGILVWRVWRRTLGLGSRVGSCLGGFGSPARALWRSLFGHTLSERCGWFCSTPHGFAYCESSNERWVGSPVGQYFPSRPSSVVTWDRASTLTPARLSRAPRPDCDSPPRPLPSVSPSRRKACLSRRLVYCS